MVALSGEIKEIFIKTKVMPMATASKSGIPNVAPMASIKLVSDDTIWIMDNYMVKTLENLKAPSQRSTSTTRIPSVAFR